MLFCGDANSSSLSLNGLIKCFKVHFKKWLALFTFRIRLLVKSTFDFYKNKHFPFNILKIDYLFYNQLLFYLMDSGN